MMAHWWASVVVAAGQGTPLGSTALDTIRFGESCTSAPSARCTLRNASVQRVPSTAGGDSMAVIIDQVNGGRVEFTMAVDPIAANHLTVKFWGDALVMNGTVLDRQQNTWLLDPTNNFAQYGWAHSWPCELDQSDPTRGYAADGPFPGRWQYATYPLPMSWTAGRRALRLGLGTGLFQWYEGPQFYPARPMFTAYTHTAPYLDVPSSEAQGLPPPVPQPRGMPANISEIVATQLEAAIEHLLAVQAWNWSLVETGRIPACLFGAVSTNGFHCSAKAGQPVNFSDCKRLWQSEDDAGNLPWTSALLALGEAYNSTARWAVRYAKRPWFLDRVVAAIDVHVRAQGSNGGFRRDHGDGTGQWVGGPHRLPAGNPLEGWGHTALARAFACIHEGMVAAGLLDVAIDDDDDPQTPNVTRATCYLRLFNLSRGYLDSIGATFCPNQEVGDAKGVWAANHAVRLLAPTLAWPEHVVLSRVIAPAIGLANFSDRMWAAKIPDHPMPRGNWVTISPAGISLEAIGSLAGGYSAGYSDILDALDQWCSWAAVSGERASYTALTSVISRMASAMAMFRLVGRCRDLPVSDTQLGEPYRCLRNTAFITWRNNENPGQRRTPIAPHTALVLQNQLYRRELQVFLQNGGGTTVFNGPPNRDAHWVSELTNAIPFAENIDALLTMPRSTAHLPQEPDQPDFGWGDPVGRTVVARCSGSTFFATLQWRHDTAPHNSRIPFAPSIGKPVTANGICRVHLTEAERVDRLATVQCSPSAGGHLNGLHSLSFGQWLVALNSDLYADVVWPIPTAAIGMTAVELVSGAQVPAVPSSWRLLPNQTVVLHLK